jgi:hypothetical protein
VLRLLRSRLIDLWNGRMEDEWRLGIEKLEA